MDVRSIDPRDMRREWNPRAYRVTFWRRLPLPPGIPEAHVAYESDDYELTGGDVADVLAWATARCGPDQTFDLGAVISDDRADPGLVRLVVRRFGPAGS